MSKHRLILVALVVAAALATVATATAAPDEGPGAVYTLTNSPAGNAVVTFDRAADGTLSPTGSVPTGGVGTGTGLGSQGALVLSDNGKWLVAVNAGSNSVSLFRVAHDGVALADTAPSGGATPISVTLRGDLAYVVNAGAGGSISGFTVAKGALEPLAGSTRALGAGTAGPAQVQFSPDGRLLVVTEKASSTIDVFAVDRNGVAGAAVTSPSAGSTPFGFDFDNKGHLLTSDAGGTASSYDVSAAGATPITGAVATHQAAPCWLVASNNGRFAYTANGGSGTISGFSVGHDGSLALLQPSGVSANLGATSHPLDMSISKDGKYLYNLTDGSHLITGFRVEDDGSLTPAGTTAIPVGAAGIAAR